MRSAVLCHVAEDASFAYELAGFLETNLPLTIARDEGMVRPGFDLVDAAEWGLSADLALVLLSPESVPGVWVRARWEPVLLAGPREFGTLIAFLLLDDCKFPELLRRGVFFDLRQSRLEGQRALKRWLLSKHRPAPDVVGLPRAEPVAPLPAFLLAELQREIGDRPGAREGLSEDATLAFVQECRDDFEGVFWIDCAHRSRAGVVGDTAQALGLRLPGTLDQNRNALQCFLVERRCLLVFANMAVEDRDLVDFTGRTSRIFAASGAVPGGSSLEPVATLFCSWAQNHEACLRTLGDAQYWLRWLHASGERLPEALRLGAAMVALLKHCDRLAEAHEALEMMAQAVRAQGDLLTAHRLAWEQSWILERWGEPVSAPPPMLVTEPMQLDLGFG
ncbi:MAG: toll/interleukin-1 receptor domain-containing protein [Bryobacteraceae bacterium]